MVNPEDILSPLDIIFCEILGDVHRPKIYVSARCVSIGPTVDILWRTILQSFNF